MKTTFVSSYAFSEATRLSLARMQTDLVRANKELSTGRYADIGLALGHETSQTVSLWHDFQSLGKLIDTNSIVATRLDVTQHSLGEFVATAQDFLDTLIAIKNGDTGKTVARQSAQVSLKALIAGLNTSLNGEYIFAGINTDVRPITDYFQNPPTRSLEVVGEKGKVSVNYLANKATLVASGGSSEAFEAKGFTRNDLFLNELKYFFHCVDKGIDPTPSLEEGLEVVRIALGAKREQSHPMRLASGGN